ncbi:unnamed protein product [Adineta ricciae]|uniref:NAD(P)(+)--arginine ADP-ribosyltransferase n=1 Tax=Adineta ricciae TaxID=249248 RepID=A0A815S8V0_ADIRI|nr:unnamed protein product [Adineta ricciae]CAF1488716.1 unnamed protein product [Adineta ricciae]
MTSRNISESQNTLRFLNVVEEESLEMISPIEDYESAPLVSLHQAILPLTSIVPEIERMVQIINTNCGELKDGLSRDESNSIRLYTFEWQPLRSSVQHLLNKTLRSGDRQQLRPWHLFLRLLLTALLHLPSTPLIVFRSANMDLSSKYVVGKTITWCGFSSCVKRTNHEIDKHLHLNWAGRKTLFLVKCYSGKDIHRHSMHDNDNEVLLPPARRFNVVSSKGRGKGVCVIELNEIEPACSIRNVQFSPVSPVSLSRKSLPAALPNRKLEEHLASYHSRNAEIDLKSMRLTDVDMDIIVSECIIKRQCSDLILSDNKFTSNGIVTLSLSLRKNVSLMKLDLSDNKIAGDGAHSLCEALRTNTTLTVLHLSNNQIGNKGVERLSIVLKTNTALAILDLSKNSITNSGAQTLSEALTSNTGLAILNLSNNSISSTGIRSLSDALLFNKTLLDLDLSRNSVADNGVQALREALSLNTELGSLSLSRNSITDDGAQMLSEVLRTNVKLTILNLSQNLITDHGAQALAKGLRLNTVLNTLDLSGNSITDSGAQALSETLETNTTLTKLDLSGNLIVDEGIQALKDTLRRNTKLTILYELNYQRADPEGIQALNKAFYNKLFS